MIKLFRKIYIKIHECIFYHKYGFYTSQFRDMIYFRQCCEKLERSGLSFNDYIQKEFEKCLTVKQKNQ